MTLSFSPWFFSAFFSSFLILIILSKGDPTDGFTEVKLTESDFHVQSPDNLAVSKRYSFKDGVRKFWVYSTDNPFSTNTDTKPRTEVRIENHDYSTGVWQFEGYGYVPSGTTGVSIMQIFGADEFATSFMLHVYNGKLMYYNTKLIQDNMYDKWFRLNVIHTVGGNIRVFIDLKDSGVFPNRGGEDHYFKFGVYTQNNSSDYMESWWKNVTILKKT